MDHELINPSSNTTSLGQDQEATSPHTNGTISNQTDPGNGTEHSRANSSVWDVMVQTQDISKFRSALQLINLDKLLALESSLFTVFAPVDQVLEQNAEFLLYTSDVDTWTGPLTALLSNHIFEGILYTNQLFSMDGQILMSTNGESFVVEVLADSIFLRGADDSTDSVSMVQRPYDSLQARNGLVHSIDGLLLSDAAQSSSPPSQYPSPPSPSPVGMVTSQPTYTPTITISSNAVIKKSRAPYKTNSLKEDCF